jgi:hypothetical protein
MFQKISSIRKNELIVSDAHTSIPYYIYFNKTPDFMLKEDLRNLYDSNDKDVYLNISYISYLDLEKVGQDIFVIMWYSPPNIPQEEINFLNTRGELIYKKGAKRLYLLRSSVY